MYLEFLLLIYDYFKTLTRRVFLYEIFTPIVIGLIVYLLLSFGNVFSACSIFLNNALTLLGVLVGFSITIITILTTGNSRNLEEIKKKKTDLKINGEKVTLYRLLLINFTYSVVIEVFLIVIALIYPLLSDNFSISLNFKITGFSIIVLTVVHILLLTIRNLTDFYFILIKKDKIETPNN